MIVRTYKYNNYYNRIIKGANTTAGYGSHLDEEIGVKLWKYGDGVRTEYVIKTNDTSADYLLLLDDYGNIDSRWFIMEMTYECAGKYRLSLRRDVIYDNLESVVSAPCFIEKARLSANNPLIYNSEQMTYNQIKKTEHLLKDKSGMPWIVGYIKKNATGQFSVPLEEVDVLEVPSLNGYAYSSYFSTPATFGAENLTLGIFNWAPGLDGYDIHGIDLHGNLAQPLTGSSWGGEGWNVFLTGRQGYKRINVAFTGPAQLRDNLKLQAKNFSWSQYEETIKRELETDSNTLQLLEDEQNRIIHTQDTGKYYKIKVVYGSQQVKSQTIAQGSGLYNQLNNLCSYTGKLDLNDLTGEPFVAQGRVRTLSLDYEDITIAEATFSFTNDRPHTTNQPYDIFAIPVGKYRVDGPIHQNNLTSSSFAFKMASAISAEMGDNLLDLQLLGYCPIPSIIRDYKSLGIPLTSKVAHGVLNGADLLGSYYWVANDSITTQIWDWDVLQGFHELVIPRETDPVEVKVQSETTFCRFVSPNYNGTFEINPARNGGISGIRADITYRPYSPYIRIYPEFGELYGANFGDARGLICGGDFSLPRTTSDWISYQQQNKNYLVQFDRQIENMEINNALAYQSALGNVITGAIGAGASTGMVGGVLGLGAGLGIGAGAGVFSGIAGALDMAMLSRQQAEALDYTKDNFGYMLGNIQARPYNINRLSAFDINNKIWPILETYSATEEEKEALRNKIKYNGMTVMTIGTIQEYIWTDRTYIKGQIIQLNDLPHDYHMAVEIAGEINKGVYI